MTREEEIREASATTLLEIDCDIHHAVISAFQDGARWADSNPNISSLWHDISEEPKEDMDILCIYEHSKTLVIPKIRSCFYECLKDNNAVKWAYINDLLPKEKLENDDNPNK